MGNRLVKFEFTPCENEQLEACVIVPKEVRSVIHGIVKNHKHCVVKDAVVTLYEVISSCNKTNLKPVGHTFTDDHGQFIFGPLCPGRQYLVKVWINEIKVRPLFIAPPPGNECDRECDHEQDHEHPTVGCRSCSDETDNEADNVDDKDSD